MLTYLMQVPHGFFGAHGILGALLGLIVLVLLIWAVWSIFNIIATKIPGEAQWIVQIARIILIVVICIWLINWTFGLGWW